MTDRLEEAEQAAAWTVSDYFDGAYSDTKLVDPEDADWQPPARHNFASPADATANLKAVAMRFGASLAGTTLVNPQWMRQEAGQHAPPPLPDGVAYALVLALAVDRKDLKSSPGVRAAIAAGLGDSRMSAIATSLAEYVRLLGYRALGPANEPMRNVPLAVRAGLGVVGRSGLLLTREYGPCVRLAAVLTDLPLAQDPAWDEGAESFCAKCGACARACPAQAIPADPQPRHREAPGQAETAPWPPMDPARCRAFWERNGNPCATCVAVCPFGPRAARNGAQ